MHVIARCGGMPDLAAGDRPAQLRSQGCPLASYVNRKNARKPALGS
jgi:hypothetical protein